MMSKHTLSPAKSSFAAILALSALSALTLSSCVSVRREEAPTTVSTQRTIGTPSTTTVERTTTY